MAYNSTDFYIAPFASGIVPLSHEECVEVITACKEIIEEFEPTREMEEATDTYVISTYNRIDWKKGINGDTYSQLKMYDVETMSEGLPLKAVETNDVISE